MEDEDEEENKSCSLTNNNDETYDETSSCRSISVKGGVSKSGQIKIKAWIEKEKTPSKHNFINTNNQMKQNRKELIDINGDEDGSIVSRRKSTISLVSSNSKRKNDYTAEKS